MLLAGALAALAGSEARAQASPVQYINSVPAHLRAIYEQLLGQAYPAGSANRPAVSYMQKQASFQ